MSIPIRPADWEHFSIVRESLSLDRLHVAVVGRDRGQLLDYAAALAITLSEQDGWHVEKYDPERLETLIVDLMLNRFDAALQTVSGHRSASSARRLGCVLFIPEAQSLPRATFQQLVRLAAGTRDHRLRLVALFPGNGQACKERIAWMGAQVARWDLDDDAASANVHTLFADAAAQARMPAITVQPYRYAGRLLAGATVALTLGVLTFMWPAISGIAFDHSVNAQTGAQDKRATALAGTLGPESLPISAPPTRDTGDEANQHASHNASQHTDPGANGDIRDLAKPEVVEP